MGQTWSEKIGKLDFYDDARWAATAAERSWQRGAVWALRSLQRGAPLSRR